MRRRTPLVALAVIALCGAGGVAVAVSLPGTGRALEDDERARLLEVAGLPGDFPVHPGARRMAQPSPGGISYSLNEPVPDVVSWLRGSLMRGGYDVFSGDVPGQAGQDEYGTRWLHFHRTGRTGAGGVQGAGGSIIVRPIGRGLVTATEVKILSLADERLAPPTVPPGTRLR